MNPCHGCRHYHAKPLEQVFVVYGHRSEDDHIFLTHDDALRYLMDKYPACSDPSNEIYIRNVEEY